jgi:putative chitinase
MPAASAANVSAYLPFLKQAMVEFEINNPARVAGFLAQLGHESGQFRYMYEIWGPTPNQKRYEPPSDLARDLGNTAPGDGKRFKGRGPIQITGRSNYKRYGDLLNVNLIDNPDRAAEKDIAFRTAGAFWKMNNLNQLADRQWYMTITKRINGGFNGLDDRVKQYERALNVLGGPRLRDVQNDPADDSGIPHFPRGLDGEGQIVPTAQERNAKARKKAEKKVTKKAAKKPAKKAAKKPTKKTTKKKSR